MAATKLLLDDDLSEEFDLIAIHCSDEAYKLAYALNKHLELRLQRKRVDLDYSNDGLLVTFPIFEFEDQNNYTTYHLVGNVCKSVVARTQSTGGLFDAQSAEKVVISHLLPESKQVDYFLKISSDLDQVPVRGILGRINEIAQVISAYEIDSENIKSSNNLIFN